MRHRPTPRHRTAAPEVYGYQYVYTQVVGLPQEDFGEALSELAQGMGAHDSEWKSDKLFWVYFYNTDDADDFLSEVADLVSGLPGYGKFDNWTIRR